MDNTRTQTIRQLQLSIRQEAGEKKEPMKNVASYLLGIVIILAVLLPGAVHACACGCGVFDVGTSAMLPSGAGGTAFLEYDYQDQSRNWSGSSSAVADSNSDKDIRTNFVTLGLQYMLSRSWGIQATMPYWYRHFETQMGMSDAVSVNYSGLGDIRIRGVYTGFSEDLSTGVTFGVKLPTGSFTQDSNVVDRDTQIGSGSTDILLGGFYRHALTADNSWTWFLQAQLDQPIASQNGYDPGREFDASAGIHYNKISLGPVRIKPLAQIIASERAQDTGPNASDMGSGYQRILLSPGVEFHLHSVKLYTDVELPVYQYMNGNQLAAPVLVKVLLSSSF
jgi:hypothetical protein